MTHLAGIREEWRHTLAASREALSLSAQELPMALGLAASDRPLLAVIDAAPRALSRTKAALEAWTDLMQLLNTWHLIAGPLSEQEQTGDILSATSLALHHLYNNALNHHFLLPLSLTDAEFPTLDEYRTARLTLHTGERRPIRELSEQLSVLGFRRHDTSLEPGSFRVRGEQVDLKHPANPGWFTLTFLGSSIESIIHHQGRRSRTLPRLTLSPVAFPEATEPLADILSQLSSSTLWQPAESHLTHPESRT